MRGNDDRQYVAKFQIHSTRVDPNPFRSTLSCIQQRSAADWVDGAYRGIAVPKSTPPEIRRQVSDMMDAINKDPELRKKMFESGFEVTDIGLEQIPSFMKERTRKYMNSAKALGLVK